MASSPGFQGPVSVGLGISPYWHQSYIPNTHLLASLSCLKSHWLRPQGTEIPSAPATAYLPGHRSLTRLLFFCTSPFATLRHTPDNSWFTLWKCCHLLELFCLNKKENFLVDITWKFRVSRDWMPPWGPYVFPSHICACFCSASVSARPSPFGGASDAHSPQWLSSSHKLCRKNLHSCTISSTPGQFSDGSGSAYRWVSRGIVYLDWEVWVICLPWSKESRVSLTWVSETEQDYWEMEEAVQSKEET